MDGSVAPHLGQAMAEEKEELVVKGEGKSHGVANAKAARRENLDQLSGYAKIHVDGVTGGAFNRSVVKLVVFEDRAISNGETVKLTRVDSGTLIIPRHLFAGLVKSLQEFDAFMTKAEAARAEQAKTLQKKDGE